MVQVKGSMCVCVFEQKGKGEGDEIAVPTTNAFVTTTDAGKTRN